MVKQTFAHIGLSCKDPIPTEKFYTRHFGFKRSRVFQVEGHQIVFIKSESGDLSFELFQSMEAHPFPPEMGIGPNYPGFRHLAFQVENIDIKLKTMGDEARITAGPMDFSHIIPNWRVVWIADPDDRIIEISQGYRDQDHPHSIEKR